MPGKAVLAILRYPSRAGANVIEVEAEPALVNRGIANAAINQLSNANFEMLDLHKDGLHHAGLQKLAGRGFNKLLLDPPRSGALQVVTALRPEQIVYVACNPAILARDADILVNQHCYRFTHCGAIDMFPHTAHIESMAVFALPNG